MSKSPTTPRRLIVSLNLPRYQVPLLVVRARAIVRAMTGNPFFPDPRPPLTTVAAAVDALDAAETATLTRTKGAVDVRDEARRDLRALLQHLRAHVQHKADLDRERAASIIESAGMFVKNVAGPSRQVFRAERGDVSGEVKLFAPRYDDRDSYEWAYSLDGGKTWIDLPPSRQASTVVRGLTPATRVLFRYRIVTGAGPGDWSEPLEFIVE